MAYQEPWHRKRGADAANALKTLAASAYHVNSNRIAMALECASLFEGIRIALPVAAGGYQRTTRLMPGTDAPNIRRKCHSTVMGSHALMFCQDQPIPMFTVNGGDWKEHTQAILLNQAVQEEFRCEQGLFTSAHDLTAHGGLVAMASTGGCAVFPWAGWDRVRLELDDTLSIIWDTSGPYSAPLGLVRTGYYDPDWLLDHQELMFSKPVSADVIYQNVTTLTEIEWTGKRGSAQLERHAARKQVVPVRQGWRIRTNPKRAGRMMAVLDTGHILEDCEYDRSELPCAQWQYERELYGESGMPMTALVYELCLRINEITWDTDQTQRRSPQKLIAVSDEAQAKQISQAKGVQTIVVDSKLRDPREIATRQYHPDAMALLDRYEQWVDQDAMTERNHATGGGGKMATSGKHEHLRATYWTEIHAAASRRAVDFVAVETGRRMVWAYQRMVEQGIDLKRYWGPDNAREEITVADLELDESRFSKSVQPISDQANSPQARRAELKEWFEMGKLDGASFIQYSMHLDQTSATEDETEEQRWVEEQIRLWSHASREKASEEGFYQSPRPWMNPEAAARKVQTALMKAESRGMSTSEPWRLEFFELFLDECAELIERSAAQAKTTVQSQPGIGELFPALGAGMAPGAVGPGQPNPGDLLNAPSPSPGPVGGAGAIPGAGVPGPVQGGL